MIGAHQKPAHVRDDQSHPADAATDRHLAGYQRAAQEDHQPAQRPDVHAQCARLAFTQRQQVEPPAKSQQHRAAQCHRNSQKEKLRGIAGGEAAHQPEDDAGQLLFGVGQVLQQAHERREEAAEDHAHQDQHQQAAVDEPVAEQEDQQQREQAGDDGAGKQAADAQSQEDGQCAAEGRARGDADHVRVHERIAKDPL